MTRVGRGLLLAVVAAILVSGCSSEQAGSPQGGQERSPQQPTGTVAPDEVTAIGDLLADRQTAIQASDRSGFLAGVAEGSRTAEATYFDNLVQLPLATYRLKLDHATVAADQDGFVAVVNVIIELRGFDSDPVRQPERFRFEGSGDDLRVLSSHDDAWSAQAGALVQPWETGPIQVRSRGMVLGIFDDRSVADADALLAAVERSVTDVRSMVDTEWEGSVVVYALSDEGFLRSLDLPGDADRLNAVAFPVHVAPHDELRASTRIALHPSALTMPLSERDRVLRHELVHVSIGSRGDQAPTWLSEGIAEYVAAEPMPAAKRSISRGALKAARAGLSGLPADDEFAGPDAGTAYGVAWYAVAYLSTSYGPYLPFDLLTAMHLRGDDQSEGDILDDYTGMSEAELADRAGRMIRSTYR